MRVCIHRWPRGFVLASSLLIGLAGARSASAQGDRTVEITWLAPEGCPTQGALHAQIDELLGGVADERAGEDLTVRAKVEHGALWLVTIETRKAASEGHRTIQASNCQGLANATALIVALMIDPDAVAARADKTTASAPSPPPPSPPSVVEVAPPAPSAPRRTFGLMGIALAANLGVLPAVDVGPAVVLGLRRGGWKGELRFAYGLRTTHSEPVAVANGAYGQFRFHAATLAGCYTTAHSIVELGPCVAGEAGLVQGEGIGADRPARESAPWLALGAGGLLAVEAASWLRFLVHVDVMVPLWRPEFVLRIMDVTIFRSQPVGGRLTMGVEAQF